MVKLKFKRRPIKQNIFNLNRGRPIRFVSSGHTSPAFGSFLQIPRVRSIGSTRSTMKRPALSFYGDSDGDGVMNGFDCAPFNPRKQGPEHKKASKDYDFKYGKGSFDKDFPEHKEKKQPKEYPPYSEKDIITRDDFDVLESRRINAIKDPIKKDIEHRKSLAEAKEYGTKQLIRARTMTDDEKKKDMTEDVRKWKEKNSFLDDANRRLKASIEADKSLEAREELAETRALKRLSEEDEHND